MIHGSAKGTSAVLDSKGTGTYRPRRTRDNQPAFAHRANILATGKAGMPSALAACATETVPLVARSTADKRFRSAFPKPLSGSIVGDVRTYSSNRRIQAHTIHLSECNYYTICAIVHLIDEYPLILYSVKTTATELSLLPIAHAVVAQGVAVVPEFLDDTRCIH